MTLPHIQVNKEWELDFIAYAERRPGGMTLRRGRGDYGWSGAGGPCCVRQPGEESPAQLHFVFFV